MNISSVMFVFAIVYFNKYFEIQSRILQFMGKHAFSIYILQRIPMTIMQYYDIFKNNKYFFVVTAFCVTVIISVVFDYLIKKIDISLETRQSKRKRYYSVK